MAIETKRAGSGVIKQAKGNLLLIAEKPDLMRKIEACYDKNRDKIPYTITFTAQRGHLVTLKYPDEIDEELKEWSWDTLPIDPEKHGGWQYKVIEEQKTGNFMTSRERYDYIKKEIYSGQYDGVINAGDPDQEGELLVRLVLMHCKNRLPIYRFWTNDLTEKHILDALINLRDDENDPQLINLLNAAHGRQRADYLFGMNLSRAATLKMGARVACGRVKTPILSIVCKREDEINNFVPRTVYGVKAHYEEGFDGMLIGSGEEDPDINEDEEETNGSGIRWFDKKEEAEKIAKSLKRAPEITVYETKRQTSYAPKLFKLATAQIEAGKMGYSAADTLRIIQGLYEKKLLSYPRTGCEYLGGDEDFSEMLEAASCVPELRKYTDSITDKDIARVKKTKTWVNAKELEKEGHSALVPTTTRPDWPALDKEERDIYRMVCAQFVAPFLPPLVQDKTTLIAETDGCEFRSTGKTLVDPGWTAVFNRAHADTVIPAHKKGDILVVAQYEVTDKTTKCPKRYSTADLIAICENPIKYLDNKAYKRLGKKLKIGTPATRAGIIEELIKNDRYLKNDKEGRRDVVVPTNTGRAIIANIHDCAICKVDLTGEWEEQLEKVRRGELSLDAIDGYMMDRVTVQVEEFRCKDMTKIETEGENQRIGKCPFCGKTLIRGKKVFFCTGYKTPGCKAGGAIEKYGSKISIAEFTSMLAGETITKEMTKGGRTWKQQIACDKKTGKIIYPNEYVPAGIKCPCCGGNILRSATIYKCEKRDGKNCDIMIARSFGGVDIPDGEIEKLFVEGKSDVITGFYSEKSKKHYNAYLYIDKEAKKVALKYSDPEIKTKYECPICGHHLVRKGFRLLCSGKDDGSCSFAMPATMSKKDMPDAFIKKMLSMVRSGAIGGEEKAYISDEDISTEYVCPVCGKPVVRNGLWFKCTDEECGFSVYRIMSGHITNDREIDAIFNRGKTDVITDFESKKKKGKNFTARLAVDRDNKRIVFSFDDINAESRYKCPICGDSMNESPALIECGCGFKIWKTQCGRKLSEHEIEDLVNRGETGYLKMKSKKGAEFEAKLVIDKEEKRVSFEFRPKKD